MKDDRDTTEQTGAATASAASTGYVEVYCSIRQGHCEGCEVGSGKFMSHRVKCTGPDWYTGRHSIFIEGRSSLCSKSKQ